MSAPVLGLLSPWALFFLRVIVGVIFGVRGFRKIKDKEGTARAFAAAGFPKAGALGKTVGGIEFVGGLAVLLGAYAQLAALALVVLLVFALAWKIKSREVFIGGYEFEILLLAACLILGTLGGTYLFSLESFLPQIFL